MNQPPVPPWRASLCSLAGSTKQVVCVHLAVLLIPEAVLKPIREVATSRKLHCLRLAASVLGLLLGCTGNCLSEDEFSESILLSGQHRFSPGDDPVWAEPDYDDFDWQLIDVPQDWEAAGVPFDTHIGWYRIRFSGADWMHSDQAAVLLGPVSDADEVWLNGRKIGGMGTIDSHYETAAFAPRLYRMPADFIVYDRPNILAVRVMRVYFSGGLTSSPAVPPMIGYHHELSVLVRGSQRLREFVLAVLITVWAGAVFLGLTLFQQSELRGAFQFLAVVMMLYIIAYCFDLTDVVASDFHNADTEMALNLMVALSPWLFVQLTARMLQQSVSGFMQAIIVASCCTFAIGVICLSPSDRLAIFVITTAAVAVPGLTGMCFCIRAVLQGVSGAQVYSLGFISLFLPTLTYAFPSATLFVGSVPLDAYAAAFFVICCFSVLIIRYRILRERVDLTSKALLTAQEEERKRLSRELHDGVNQSLFAVRLALQMEEEKLQKGQPMEPDTLKSLVTETENVSEELRRVVRELRPAILEQMDIVDAIRWQAEELGRRGGLEVSVQTSGETTTTEVVKDHLYRICQEAIQNTLQHAEARFVRISITGQGERIHFRFEDNGRGFVRSLQGVQGHGLNTMKERAALLGGTAEISSMPGKGTIIDVRVPRGL